MMLNFRAKFSESSGQVMGDGQKRDLAGQVLGSQDASAKMCPRHDRDAIHLECLGDRRQDDALSRLLPV